MNRTDANPGLPAPCEPLPSELECAQVVEEFELLECIARLDGWDFTAKFANLIIAQAKFAGDL